MAKKHKGGQKRRRRRWPSTSRPKKSTEEEAPEEEVATFLRDLIYVRNTKTKSLKDVSWLN